MVEEAQGGVLLLNTWCSGTSCGGINPYTLTARLGLGGLAHHETVRGLTQPLGVLRKETRCRDLVEFWSVRIRIDIMLSMAIVTD